MSSTTDESHGGHGARLGEGPMITRGLLDQLPAESMWAMRYHQVHRQLQRERLGGALVSLLFALLGLAMLLGGCNVGPLVPPVTGGTGSGQGSSSGEGEGSGVGEGTGSSGSSGGDGSSSGSAPEVGLHDPCDPLDDMSCAVDLICYQDSVTGALTFCTEQCETSSECEGIGGWAGPSVCGDDGLCRHPCDETVGADLCPTGWECLFEGTDMAGSQVFNCLPFECESEPC